MTIKRIWRAVVEIDAISNFDEIWQMKQATFIDFDFQARINISDIDGKRHAMLKILEFYENSV